MAQDGDPFRQTETLPSRIDIAVWSWPLAIPQAARDLLFASLDGTERQRLERMRAGTLQDAYLAGRGMMRALLAKRLGCAPGDVAIVTGTEGKPELAPGVRGGPRIGFNLAHTGDGADGRAVLAIADACTVGIDIERVRPVRPGLAKRYFAAQEADWAGGEPEPFFALWTAKEACLKAWGRGIRGGLDAFVFAPPVPEAGAAWVPVAVPDAVGPRDDWRVVPIAVGACGLPGAVAVRARTPFEVRVTLREADYPAP